MSRLGRFTVRRFTATGWRRGLLFMCVAPRFARMSDSPAGKARFVLATVVLAVAESLPGHWRPRWSVTVTHSGGRSRFCIRGLSELDVLDEVFLQSSYEVDSRLAPSVIVDAGCNIGATLHLFAAKYPRARLIGIEPNPEVFVRLRQNTRTLAHLDLSEAALAPHDGRLRLHVGRDSWAASVLQVDDEATGVDVRAMTLRTLLDTFSIDRIDVLKVDIEGGEYGVLAAFDDWEQVGTIVLEWHEDLLGHTVDEVVGLLPRHEVIAVPAGWPGRYIIHAVPRDPASDASGASDSCAQG
jgi:FkbM family methyltransferase